MRPLLKRRFASGISVWPLRPASSAHGGGQPTATTTLAGLKGHTTNLADCPDGTPITAEFVISSYHQLWQIAQKRRRGWFSPVIARPAPAHQYPDVGTPLTNWYASNEDASRP